VSTPRRVRVLGVPVDRVDMAGATAFVEERIASGGPPATVLAVNPEKVYAIQRDPFLQGFFEGGGLLLPDGVGVVMATNVLHGRGATRVPGADLMEELCRRAATSGWRIFLYGAQDEVNRRAVDVLRERYPGIAIVGRSHGYVPDDGMDALVRAINDSSAELLFVALGSPRQEHWMSRHLPALEVRVCQGIGGTLDTITGDVKRAPSVLRRLGLEWLYRLVRQPSRWRRQIVYPRFVVEVARDAVRQRLRPAA
jgi:N-acetylglucosaminyldiphosphoundecaprenol N-acetyl-beta-D-mannosaminyltransferase